MCRQLRETVTTVMQSGCLPVSRMLTVFIRHPIRFNEQRAVDSFAVMVRVWNIHENAFTDRSRLNWLPFTHIVTLQLEPRPCRSFAERCVTQQPEAGELASGRGRCYSSSNRFDMLAAPP